MTRLSTSLGTISFANPVTVASGTFGLAYNDFFDINQLGAYVTKTITRYPKAGNKPARLYETNAGLLNSIGLQNPGVEEFIKTDLPELAKLKIPIIVSFSGSTELEFCEILRLLDRHDCISGYEINISCPNVEHEGLAFGTDKEIVTCLTTALRTLTSKELIIKLSPNVTNIAEIAQAAAAAGADSLALINTLLGMAIDPLTGKSRIARGVAGYSGVAIRPVALLNVWKVVQAVDIPILAMGGISTWQDALEFFYAGASAVAIGTANFINPCACIDIITGLDNHFKQTNQCLSDIIGQVHGIG